MIISIKISFILKQTCSWKLHVCLSTYGHLSENNRRQRVKQPHNHTNTRRRTICKRKTGTYNFFVIFKSLLFNNSNAQKKKSKTIATSKSDHTWTSCLRHYWVPASNFHIKLTLAACSASMFKMVEWFIQLPFHPHSALYRFIFIYSFLNFSSLTNFR